MEGVVAEFTLGGAEFEEKSRILQLSCGDHSRKFCKGSVGTFMGTT
jgi:hypothetical protein